jgi:hypothetical protein
MPLQDFVPTPRFEDYSEALGVKRAAYALLTGEAITARKALEWGMVNEVLPREQLIDRAYAIADHIMTQPRTVRRLTTQIVRRPWKPRVVADLDGGFGIQMFGHIAKKRAVHGQEHIRATVDYVREGRKNNFDLYRNDPRPPAQCHPLPARIRGGARRSLALVATRIRAGPAAEPCDVESRGVLPARDHSGHVGSRHPRPPQPVTRRDCAAASRR